MYSYVDEQKNFLWHCIVFQGCRFLTIDSILKQHQNVQFKLRSIIPAQEFGAEILCDIHPSLQTENTTSASNQVVMGEGRYNKTDQYNLRCDEKINNQMESCQNFILNFVKLSQKILALIIQPIGYQYLAFILMSVQ